MYNPSIHHLIASSDIYSKVHTDIGLLTIIPVTNIPQLNMLDHGTFEWVDGKILQLTTDHRPT